MRKYLSVVFATFVVVAVVVNQFVAHAQNTVISKMPQKTKEHFLIQWAKEEQQRTKELYEKTVDIKKYDIPTDSIGFESRWVANDGAKGHWVHSVMFYNKKAVQELRFNWLYTIEVMFDDWGETLGFGWGSGWGYTPESKPRIVRSPSRDDYNPPKKGQKIRKMQ